MKTISFFRVFHSLLVHRVTVPVRMTCLLFALMVPATVGASDDADLKSIFNGKDLGGWKAPSPNPFWRAVDGVLVGENDQTKKGNVLYTEKAFRDFIFECDLRWNGEIDSGVMFRRPELQLQIGVSRSLKRDMTACFYTGGSDLYPRAGQARDLDKVLKPGDWNTFRIEARGDTFTVWVNGKQVTKYTNAKYSGPGPIGVQIHPGLAMKVEFRNLRAKEL